MRIKPRKYRYRVGASAPLLVIASVAYAIAWTCYFCSVFLDVLSKNDSTYYAGSGSRPPRDDVLDTLMIWSALKPALTLFVAICSIFSLYESAALLVLAVACGVIWAGTLGAGAKLLVDRYATCNGASNPHNPCNDPLYCCAYYDVVAFCGGFGPCHSNSTFVPSSPSELRVNEDFSRLCVFVAIFTFLELILILLSFAVLLAMKRLRKRIDVTNAELVAHYNGTSNENYETLLSSKEYASDDDDTDEDDKDENDEDNDNEDDDDGGGYDGDGIKGKDAGEGGEAEVVAVEGTKYDETLTKKATGSEGIGKPKIVASSIQGIAFAPAPRSNDRTMGRGATMGAGAGANKTPRSNIAIGQQEGKRTVRFALRGDTKVQSRVAVKRVLGRREGNAPAVRIASLDKKIGKDDDDDDKDNDGTQRRRTDRPATVGLEELGTLIRAVAGAISNRLERAYLYAFYHVNTFGEHEMVFKGNSRRASLSEGRSKRKRNHRSNGKKRSIEKRYSINEA